MDENWQESLQAEIEQLEKDKLALQQELKTTGESVDNEQNAAVVKKALVPQVPVYIQNIDALARAADSEGVRLSANKLLIEWALTNKLDPNALDADESFKELIKRIQSKAAKVKED